MENNKTEMREPFRSCLDDRPGFRADRRTRSEFRRRLRRERKEYLERSLRAESELGFMPIRWIKGIFSSGIKGAAAGMSAAGILNTAAPGLFSTLSGYLAGRVGSSALSGLMIKAGLLSVGIFTPAAFSQAGILIFGAVLGILLFWTAELIKTVIRSFRRK